MCAMSMKHQSKQSKKVRRQKLCAILCTIILTFIGLQFIIHSIQNWCVLYSDNNVIEYSGSYTFSKKEHLRNTTFMFHLGNGDIVGMPSEYLNNDERFLTAYNAQQPPYLIFRYTEHRAIFKDYRIAVSIISPSDQMVYVEETYMKKVLRGESILYVLLGLCTILLSGIMGYTFLKSPLARLVSICRKRRRKKLKRTGHK